VKTTTIIPKAIIFFSYKVFFYNFVIFFSQKVERKGDIYVLRYEKSIEKVFRVIP